jgi:hypothetical protein
LRQGVRPEASQEERQGKARPFPNAKLAQAIEGTDLSYEDLAMRFLHWPKGVVEGPDKIGSRKRWRLRVANPGRGGRYSHLKGWIDQKSGDLVQAEGYNRQERRPKRFKVTDLMRVGNTLKRMRVDNYHQETGKYLGMTYLEFDKPKRVAPKGLRETDPHRPRRTSSPSGSPCPRAAPAGFSCETRLLSRPQGRS